MRWPASFYGKTDDDAVIDLPPLLGLLEQLPHSAPVFTGIIRYSSINQSTLAGMCWGAGAMSALRKRALSCAGADGFGPFPYAEGPLILMSAPLQRWVAPRLKLDDRQRCHFEDLLLAREVASQPAVTILNLVGLIGKKDVLPPVGRRNTGEWMGTEGFLAHWTRTEEHFRRAVAEFPLRRRPTPPTLQCAPWAASFEPIRTFPCCRNWTLCEPDAPSPARVMNHKRKRIKRRP